MERCDNCNTPADTGRLRFNVLKLAQFFEAIPQEIVDELGELCGECTADIVSIYQAVAQNKRDAQERG